MEIPCYNPFQLCGVGCWSFDLWSLNTLLLEAEFRSLSFIKRQAQCCMIWLFSFNDIVRPYNCNFFLPTLSFCIVGALLFTTKKKVGNLNFMYEISVKLPYLIFFFFFLSLRLLSGWYQKSTVTMVKYWASLQCSLNWRYLEEQEIKKCSFHSLSPWYMRTSKYLLTLKEVVQLYIHDTNTCWPLSVWFAVTFFFPFFSPTFLFV